MLIHRDLLGHWVSSKTTQPDYIPLGSLMCKARQKFTDAHGGSQQRWARRMPPEGHAHGHKGDLVVAVAESTVCTLSNMRRAEQQCWQLCSLRRKFCV
jgi:hypothetical protein